MNPPTRPFLPAARSNFPEKLALQPWPSNDHASLSLDVADKTSAPVRNPERPAMNPMKHGNRLRRLIAFSVVLQHLLGALLIGGVLYLVFQILWEADRTASESKNWQATTARVIESRVEKYRCRKSGSGRYVRRKGDCFRAVVRYQYDFGNALYVNSRIGARIESYDDKTNADEIIAMFPPNAEITAFVNPEKPSEAVLFQGYEHFNSMLHFVWVIAALAFIVIIRRLLRWMNSDKAKSKDREARSDAWSQRRWTSSGQAKPKDREARSGGRNQRDLDKKSDFPFALLIIAAGAGSVFLTVGILFGSTLFRIIGILLPVAAVMLFPFLMIKKR